jgi:hypothetical protein
MDSPSPSTRGTPARPETRALALGGLIHLRMPYDRERVASIRSPLDLAMDSPGPES